MSEQHTALAKYDEMITAIAACHEVDEVKAIRTQAIALEHYQRQAQNRDAEKRVCEIRIRAERKAGQILKRMERKPGRRTDLSTTSPSEASRSDKPLVQSFAE